MRYIGAKRGEIMAEQGYIRLYDKALLGEKWALEELLRLYSDPLTRFAYCFVKDSAAAEDIMEEAFVKLLLKEKHFSHADNLRAYLYKIVRNKALDYLRKHKKRVPLADYENVLCAESAEQQLLQREEKRCLYRCLQQLPSQYAEVLYLTYFENYKAEEICKITHRNKKQVYNLLARAKSTLKELLIKEGIEYGNV